jgi:N-acetyltransferase
MNFNFENTITLQNDRALLHPLTMGDFPYLIPAATVKEDLVQYSPYYIHTPEHLKSFIQQAVSDRENELRYAFHIYDKKRKALAGSTSFAAVSNKDRRLEIGWTWLGPSFQQTGLNRACKFLLLCYAFDTLGFERVEFKTDARNKASRTAIEKLGGQYEGALRSHTLMKDGYRRTTIYYSILKEEWPQLKSTVFLPYTNNKE